MNFPKIRYQSGGFLLAGCLLVSAAQAQQMPPIQAADAAPAAAPATETAPVPRRVAPPAVAPRAPLLEMSVRDIPIKELLNTVGTQFGINLAVSGDIDGVIGSINLTNQTAEEALKTIVQVAGNLSITRMDNGTYIVRKALPGENIGTAQNLSPAHTFAPANNFDRNSGTANMGAPGGFTNSITPTNTFDGGFDGASPVGNGNRTNDFRALPPLGADPLPVLAPVQQQSRRSRMPRTIKLRNIKPSLMAYWLDPAHNAMPQTLQSSDANEKFYGDTPVARKATEGMGIQDDSNSGFNGLGSVVASPSTNPYLRNAASSQVRPMTRSNSQFGNNNNNNNNNNNGGANSGAGTFDLPGDIQQLISVDPQNVLLVAGGSDEDLRSLQEIVDVLDQPLRQVEIEAQFIDLNTNDARAFGIDFSTSRGNIDAATTNFASAPVQGAFQIGFVRGNFQARLNALVANNRAKIINAPRVTAINNLTASLRSTTRRPIILTSVSQNIGGQQAQNQQLLFVSTTVGLTVTPTINNDDTITVLMQPEVSSQGPANSGLQDITQRSLQTIANVRDGDTIVLGGLKSFNSTRQNFKVPLLGDLPIIGRLFQSRTDNDVEQELIVFLTARILRRAGDDTVVPGT